jgi:exonuclease SbcD
MQASPRTAYGGASSPVGPPVGLRLVLRTGGCTMGISFYHLADVHLGRIQAGDLTAAQVAQRQADALLTLFSVLDRARQASVPLLFICGDLFEHDSIDRGTVAEVRDRLASLTATRVFLAAGNHDYAAPDSYYRTLSWPDNVHLFLGDWESISVPHLGVVVHGCGFSQPECDARRLAELRVEQSAKLRTGQPSAVAKSEPVVGVALGPERQAVGDASGQAAGAASGPTGGQDHLHVAVLHGDIVAGPHVTSRYLPIAPADLDQCGVDYVALGHVHRRHLIPGSAGLYRAAYSGALEPMNFAEEGEHGYLEGELERGGARLRFVPAAARNYHRVEVDVTGCSTMAAVLEMAAAALSPIASEHAVRLTLVGALRPDITVDRVRLAALGDRFFAFRLVEATEPDVDLNSLARGHSIQAAFVRRMQVRLAAAAADEREVVQKALRLGLAALGEREVWP